MKNVGDESIACDWTPFQKINAVLTTQPKTLTTTQKSADDQAKPIQVFFYKSIILEITIIL